MKRGVTLEDRFVNAGRSAIGWSIAGVWRVVQLFDGPDGVPYARLVNVADQTLTKTVATGALVDRALFRHAGRTAALPVGWRVTSDGFQERR